MTTVDQMVDRILLSMDGSSGPQEIDVLSGTVTDSQTTGTSTNGSKSFRIGATIEIEEELLRIVDVAGTTLTFLRGQYGSTAVAHSSGALIRLNPRHSRMAIMQNMKEEIRSWSSEVFQVANEQVTVSDSNSTLVYDFLLAATSPDFIHALKIQRKNPTSPVVRWGEDKRARILRGLDTGDHASGLALQLTEKIRGFTQYNVIYGKKFDVSTWTSAVDLTADAGIPEEFEDIVEMGTMGRLLVGKETRRIQRDSQPQPRAARDVREGAALQTGATYRQMAAARLGEEKKRLQGQWPIRIR